MKQKIDIVKPQIRLDENLISSREGLMGGKRKQANEMITSPKSAANMDLISMLDTPKYSRQLVPVIKNS